MIEYFQEAQAWPARSGIYLASGTIILLTVSMPWETKAKNVSVQIGNSLQWDRVVDAPEFKARTHLMQLCERDYPELDIRVVGGEGSHGSEGFLALTHLTSRKLRWLAFFRNSNPFTAVSFDKDTIIAESNLEDRWSVPVVHPETLSVLPSPRHTRS